MGMRNGLMLLVELGASSSRLSTLPASIGNSSGYDASRSYREPRNGLSVAGGTGFPAFRKAPRSVPVQASVALCAKRSSLLVGRLATVRPTPLGSAPATQLFF